MAERSRGVLDMSCDLPGHQLCWFTVASRVNVTVLKTQLRASVPSTQLRAAGPISGNAAAFPQMQLSRLWLLLGFADSVSSWHPLSVICYWVCHEAPGVLKFSGCPATINWVARRCFSSIFEDLLIASEETTDWSFILWKSMSSSNSICFFSADGPKQITDVFGMLLTSDVANLMNGGLFWHWSSSSQLRSRYSFKYSISESMSDENLSINNLSLRLTLISWSLSCHSRLMRDDACSITGATAWISWTFVLPAIDKSLIVLQAFFDVCMSSWAVVTMPLAWFLAFRTM